MKKWLSLIVMTSLLLGAAYLAVATEAGRDMLNRTATTRAMLAEIDAMLAKDSANPELLAKREEVMMDLAAAGQAVQADPNVKDAAYLRSVGAYEEAAAMEQAQFETQTRYLEELLAREREGLPLTPSEKADLVDSGLLDQAREDRDGLDNTGGPSATFGYRWVDNLGGDTASFVWEELDTTAGAISLTAINGSDDANTGISWANAFTFFGTSYTSAFVTTNGYIAFGTGSSDFSNDCRRSAGTPTGPTIFAFWDDGNTSTGASSDGGRIVYRDFGDHVTVTWDSVGTCCTSGTDRLDYQAQIWMNGKIKFQYRQIQKISGTSANGTTPTIGIQQSNNAGGLDSLIYSCNAGTVMDSATTNALDGRAIWFYQLFLNNDFATSAILQPSPVRVSPNAAFNVVGRFRNAGNITQTSPVKYSFNGGPVVSEVTAALAQGISEDHDFAGTETAPAVVGDYTLTLWTDLATDQDRTNDTLRLTVQVRECADETQTDAFVDAGTTCGAINDFFNTCMGTADASEDYIYQWVVTQAGNYNLRYIVPTSATLGFALSSSCPPDSFNCIASANLFQDTVSFSCVPLNAGTYYITLDRSTGCGTYTLQAGPCIDRGRCCYNNGANCADTTTAACANLGGSWDSTKTCANNPCPLILAGGETCAEAVAIPSIPYTLQSSTTGGIDDDPGFQCTLGSSDPYEGFNTAPDKWYTVQGTGDTIFVTLCNPATTFDTQILVVCSGDCQNFTCVAGNDDATCTFSGLRSTAWFCSEVGRTYYVVVDGWGTASGTYELSLTRGGACTGAVDCAPTGRCCYLNNGAPACVDNLAAECAILNGQWNDAASCAATPCPVGRCCYVSGGFGACETNTELECGVLNGTWDGTTTCETDPCPTGRCCYDDNGNTACVNDIAEVCAILNGVWDGTLTCEANPCPIGLQGSDLCADAVLVPNLNQQYIGTNVGATAETGLPACASWYGGSGLGVWYKVVGTGNTITIAFCDPLTTYDSEVGVFCHPDCDSLVCVTSDDDFCNTPALASQVSWCSTLGAEYKVLVTAYSTGTGTFAFTVTDDGVACVPTVVCPTPPAAPCDPVVDLAPYVATVGNVNDHLRIHFTAPQDETYIVWSTTNPNNDGNPNAGSDPDWTLEATLPNLLAGPQVWDAPAGFPVNFKIYVVVADCPAP